MFRLSNERIAPKKEINHHRRIWFFVRDYLKFPSKLQKKMWKISFTNLSTGPFIMHEVTECLENKATTVSKVDNGDQTTKLLSSKIIWKTSAWCEEKENRSGTQCSNRSHWIVWMRTQIAPSTIMPNLLLLKKFWCFFISLFPSYS